MNDKVASTGVVEVAEGVEVEASDRVVTDLEMTISTEGDHHKEATMIAIEAVTEEIMEILLVNRLFLLFLINWNKILKYSLNEDI